MAKLPLIWKPAKAFGGLFKAPAATFITVHCTESENTAAMAEALAGPNWFGGSKAGTSSHKVVDVDSICEGVKRNRVAYHAGPGGNTWGIAYEFCGRASWSAAKWRGPAQLQMLRNAAPHIADDLIAITGSRAKALAAARWLSLVQVARHENGLCTHNDIRLALGGTTHSDPGPNFPYAELLAYVAAELGGTSGTDTNLEDDMTPAQWEELVGARIDRGIAPAIRNLQAGLDLLIGAAGRPLEAEARLTARLDAQAELIRQLGEKQGTPIDMDLVEAAAEKGVQDAIAGIKTTIELKPANA